MAPIREALHGVRRLDIWVCVSLDTSFPLGHDWEQSCSDTA